MADIFVNFPKCPPNKIRGDIDWELEQLIEGWGRVTGGGSSWEGPGFYVDLEVDGEEGEQVHQFLDLLTSYLRALPVPEGTNLVLVVHGNEDRRIQIV